VPGVISLNSLFLNDSLVNLVSLLKAPNSIVLSPQFPIYKSSSSVNLLEKKLSFSNNDILLLETTRFRTFGKRIKGIAVNDGAEQLIWIPSVPHLHSSGQRSATLAGRINNHNQKIKTAVANNSNSNTTVSFDGMAKCCNLQKERNRY
jgi:hypothetical protein